MCKKIIMFIGDILGMLLLLAIGVYIGAVSTEREVVEYCSNDTSYELVLVKESINCQVVEKTYE